MNIEKAFLLGMKREVSLRSMEGDTVLNLGAGQQVIEGARNLDLPDWDARSGELPKEYTEGSVDHIYAHHLLEHLTGDEVLAMLKCVQSALKIGGRFLITVPWCMASLAHEDLNHKTVWEIETLSNLFRTSYYNTFQYRKAIPWKFDIVAKFIMGVTSSNLAVIFQLEKRG